MAENGSNVAEGEILLSRSILSMWFDENSTWVGCYMTLLKIPGRKSKLWKLHE